jgi:hypothetical protein
MQEIIKPKHITEEMWIALEQNTITTEDYMKILEHTCDCTWCAEHLASVMEQDTLAQTPPAYLEEEIANRAGQLDIQVQAAVKKTSKQVQLLVYSLKVGLAVAVSMLLLVATANVQTLDTSEIRQQQQENWEEEISRRAEKEDGFLKQINQATSNATKKMNAFTNSLVEGGNRDDE